MADPEIQARARFLLSEIMSESRQAITYLFQRKPRIFARHLSNVALNHDRVDEVVKKLEQLAPLLRSAGNNPLDWDALEQVGLTGDTLEWKADLIYDSLGKKKPLGTQSDLWPLNELLSYPKGKPVWSRLFKYLKSLFQSLMNAITNNEKVRLALDFIREFIDCVEASLKFVQSAETPEEV